MFELTISINTGKEQSIFELYSKLAPEIKKDGGIITKLNANGRATVTLAVKKAKKEYIKSKVLDQIVYIITNVYKFEFYKETLYPLDMCVASEAFLKAISIFDSEIDRDFIETEIDMTSEILIDSFYHFKLQSLRERWQKTARIIMQNQILSSQSSMLGVLKYLTMSSESLSLSAEVFLTKKQIKLKCFLFSKTFKRDYSGCSAFLTEIVRINPVKIDLKSQIFGENDDVAQILKQIFADKVYFAI